MRSKNITKNIAFSLILILVLVSVSGCVDGPIGDGNVTGYNVTTEEESRKIAENYVRNMDMYKNYDGKDLILVETLTARCPYCWSFKYEFDMVSKKDPDVVDRATVTVFVQEGEVVDVVVAAGKRDEEETGDIMNVSGLMGNPVYDVEVGIYGNVSLLGELLCPCFELASGGEKVHVWYDLMVEDGGNARPSVSVEGIENGDWVIVTGELKTAGEHRSLNDFWASNIEKPVSADKSSDGSEVKVPLGKVLAVNLDSNPSTGFGWNLRENSDGSVIQVVGNEFVISKTTETSPMPGAGGSEVWVFRAQKEGASNISMEYVRSWEEGVEPAETFDLIVLVE